VLNEQAGRLIADPGAADRLRDHLATGASLHEPPPGKLPDRVRQAAETGADAVIVAGGDGTVACACQALAGTATALGIIPLGTMNLLARDLGIPVDNLPQAADLLARATPRRIDTGQIGPHVFACACMLGAPARIGHHREAARARGNGPRAWLAVARAALRTLLRDRPLHLIMVIDGKPHRLRTRALTITVNALDPAAPRPFGRARLDAGRLCAYVERVRTPWQALRLLLHLARGSANDPALAERSGARIELRANRPALRLLIDGEEHLLPPPLIFEIRPASLLVLAAP
jgi:diacylglycerol kinase family enzyme